MSEVNYKPNSHRFKSEQQSGSVEKRKVQKVVTGVAKVKKKNELRKFADIFIAEDAANVKSYIVMDILIPAFKNTILDIITDSANMIFGGSKRRSGTAASKVSYRSYYDKKDSGRSSATDPRAKMGYSYDDIVLESRADAEDVLAQMDEMIETYGVASVADLYDLVGITHNYTDNKYGWSNLRSAEAVRVRDGYLLKLPKASPIS